DRDGSDDVLEDLPSRLVPNLVVSDPGPEDGLHEQGMRLREWHGVAARSVWSVEHHVVSAAHPYHLSAGNLLCRLRHSRRPQVGRFIGVPRYLPELRNLLGGVLRIRAQLEEHDELRKARLAPSSTELVL